MLKSVSRESFWHAFEKEQEMAQEESEEFLVLSLNAVMPRFKLRDFGFQAPNAPHWSV
jgi:hypothetical protein